MESWLHQIVEWREFYSFTGTAAATLMGLMFVVMSLTQQALTNQRTQGAVSAFFTPIVAFFATEIVVSMLVLIPAITPLWLGSGFAAVGVGGSAYMLVRGVHARWRRRWDLDVDDWIWYFLLPAASLCRRHHRRRIRLAFIRIRSLRCGGRNGSIASYRRAQRLGSRSVHVAAAAGKLRHVESLRT